MINGIELDPAPNPAVLDTVTGAPDAAMKQCGDTNGFWTAARMPFLPSAALIV